MGLFMFKKYKNLFTYIKTIRKNREVYLKRYNMRFDWIYRGYTVLQFPPDVMINVNKYGYDYLDSEVRKYIKDLNVFNRQLGLLEFVGLDRADQITPNNVLIVIRYRFLNTRKIANYIILLIFLIISLLVGYLIFF
jgi:predicted DNA-binding transcriptional regulator AlpA